PCWARNIAVDKPIRPPPAITTGHCCVASERMTHPPAVDCRDVSALEEVPAPTSRYEAIPRKRGLAPDLLDPCNGSGDRGVDIKVGGVEHKSVSGRPQRRNGTRLVALVTAQNVSQDVGCTHVLALHLELKGSPPGTLLRRRRDENLHVRLRTDHRPNIAAVEHGAVWSGGEFLLEIEQRGPHVRHCCDDRSRFPDRMTLEFRFVKARRIKLERRGGDTCAIVELVPGIQDGLRNCPVHQPGVEVRQPVVLGQSLGNRAFAGGRRPVNRYDHVSLAPSDRIMSANPGKLVATNETSSACTGF